MPNFVPVAQKVTGFLFLMIKTFKLMKKLLTILLSLMFTTAYTQYITPGTGVHWDLAELANNSSGAVSLIDGVYLVSEDVTISEFDTISINNPNEMAIEPNLQFTVIGTMKVLPSNGYMKFTCSDTNSYYKSIRLENSNASFFKNTIFEFGNGLDLVESNITIDSCVFRKNNDEFTSGAIDLYHSNATISNCSIFNNSGPAIASGANAGSAPFIMNNLIYNNVVSNVNKPQINLGETEEDTIKIIGNIITGMYPMAGGIAVSGLTGGDAYCIIDSNTIENNRYGFAAIGYNVYSKITNNEIHYNNIQNNPMLGGSGLNFYGDTTNKAFVSGNTISNNLWGITIQMSALPNIGQVENDSINPGMNRIYDNGNSGLVFALYNNTPNQIMAENNFWGSDDPDSVEMFIFHQQDSASLGFVDFMPLYEEEPPSGNAIDFDNKGKHHMVISNIYPNPFQKHFTIEINKHYLEKGRSFAIELYTIRGKRIFYKEYINREKVHFKVNKDFMNDTGSYILKIIQGKTVETTIIIKG